MSSISKSSPSETSKSFKIDIDFSQLRIGYVPCAINLKHPGDRRETMSVTREGPPSRLQSYRLQLRRGRLQSRCRTRRPNHRKIRAAPVGPGPWPRWSNRKCTCGARGTKRRPGRRWGMRPGTSRIPRTLSRSPAQESVPPKGRPPVIRPERSMARFRGREGGCSSRGIQDRPSRPIPSPGREPRPPLP